MALHSGLGSRSCLAQHQILKSLGMPVLPLIIQVKGRIEQKPRPRSRCNSGFLAKLPIVKVHVIFSRISNLDY